jgi:hypothetical protein
VDHESLHVEQRSPSCLAPVLDRLNGDGAHEVIPEAPVTGCQHATA